MCKRVSGGAILSEAQKTEDIFMKRMSFLKKNKNSIAQKASKLIKPGMTIIIDSGTTASELAEEIKLRSHITVITPSLAVANILAGRSEITLILPGGIVQSYSQSLTGEPAENFFKNVHADLFFMAVKGFSIVSGLRDHTISEASVKKEMLKSANATAVLADHSKFNKLALYPICRINEIKYIITDDSYSAEEREELKKIGIIPV